MRYTFDIIVVSIGIIGFFQLVSILTFIVYSYIFIYVCLNFKECQFLLVSIFHTYIYVCVYAKLKLQLYFNWFNFQLVSYFKLMHVFCWYFIKGEKIRFSYLQLVFVFSLPYFMIENKIFNWYHILKKKKNTLFWYQDVHLNVLKFGISKFCLKINTKVLICIVYMQGELNISSTYRFMMSVSCIEELNISSLCGTRV